LSFYSISSILRPTNFYRFVKEVKRASTISSATADILGLFALVISFVLRKKLTIQIHCTVYSDPDNSPIKGLKRHIVSLVVRCADAIRVVNRSEKQALADSELIDSRKIMVAPIPVDIFLDLATTPLWEKVYDILVVTRDSSDKNNYYLFKILSRLSSDENLRIAVAGIDESAVTSRGVSFLPSVRFLGQLAKSDMVKLYTQSFTFLQVSKSEGYGLAAAEALCCGLPIISFPNDGLKDYCRREDLYALSGQILSDLKMISSAVNYQYGLVAKAQSTDRRTYYRNLFFTNEAQLRVARFYAIFD
jgi:glycosyltransferase involved in cell wall biosynthesis